MKLLNDPKFEEFEVPVRSNKKSKGTEKGKIYDVMSFQLKKLEKVLEENSIIVNSTTIQGDNLEEENILKIEIHQDTANHNSSSRGKNVNRTKVSSVIPSLPYTRQNITTLASERISKLFYDVMNAIKNKKIISEILEIDETDNETELFKAFACRLD